MIKSPVVNAGTWSDKLLGANKDKQILPFITSHFRMLLVYFSGEENNVFDDPDKLCIRIN